MVAPIDAKTSFEVEGETFTLRLNFRSIALAEKEGINVLSGKEMGATQMVVLLRCMATQEHPEMTDDEAFAIVVRGGDVAQSAITRLFSDFGGKSEGNAKKAATPRKR